jgi:hypothetical protein
MPASVGETGADHLTVIAALAVASPHHAGHGALPSTVLHSDAGFDTLSVQDSAGGDFVDGGPDSDSCRYDSGDTVTGC